MHDLKLLIPVQKKLSRSVMIPHIFGLITNFVLQIKTNCALSMVNRLYLCTASSEMRAPTQQLKLFITVKHTQL